MRDAPQGYYYVKTTSFAKMESQRRQRRTEPRPICVHFVCNFYVAVAGSSSDGVTISYALPVLWMTSYFYITALRRVVCFL